MKFKWKLITLLITAGFDLRGNVFPNGNFATGDLTGFTVGGTVDNAQVLPVFGSYSPTGVNFALISNGPGAVNPFSIPDITTLTSNSFVVSSGTNLSFDYDFVSEEPNDGSGNPDFFAIQLLGSNNNFITLASGAVNSGPTQTLIPGGPIVTQDGSTFLYESGITNIDASLAAFEGQSATLQFLVSDAVDNSGDSGIVIDNIQFQSATATPELDSRMLGILGVTILMMRKGLLGAMARLRS